MASRSSSVHEDRVPVDIWHGMGFTRRPPKKDAFRDLLIKLKYPAELGRVLQRWVVTNLGLPDEAETLVGIRIDGKCLCATLRPSAKAVPLLAAVDHQAGCVLTYDAAHHGAIVLKKRLEAHPRWAALITRLGQWTSSRVQAALEATPVKARHSWCAASIPPSVQSQRRLAPVNTSRPTTNQRQAEVCIGSGANLMPRGAPEPVKMSELCINDRRSPPPS